MPRAAAPATSSAPRRLAGLALLGLAIVAGWSFSPDPRRAATAADRPALGRNGIVVSVSAPASEVGLAVLKKGGNAVDAAVATAFALAVTHPAAGNIGGGGFMVVHPGAKEKPVVIEYR